MQQVYLAFVLHKKIVEKATFLVGLFVCGVVFFFTFDL